MTASGFWMGGCLLATSNASSKHRRLQTLGGTLMAWFARNHNF